jgi:lactate dehydrogenase-like 2-hydroxyacid dehydrogenase
VLTKGELIEALQKYNPDAVLCLLTDTIDGEIFDAAPNAKVFANYAVGYNNIDVAAASQRGVTITNTPGVLTDTVAEFAMSMICAVTKRIVEADSFVRAGKYGGWGPMLLLGSDLRGKTLGILGAGRIGTRVAEIAHNGFGMNVVYYDIKQNEFIEKDAAAEFRATPEEVLAVADVVSVHVPLLDSTRHLINAERLGKMKPTASLVNTSRGPVVDENALVDALKNKTIRSAAIDVFENEPALSPGLVELPNAIITPHIASATEETRGKMSAIAAENILAHLAGKTPQNVVAVH